AAPPGSICLVNGLDMLDLNTLQGSQVTSLTCDPGDVSASRDGNKVMMASSQFVYCLYDVATSTWSHPRATGFNGEGRLSSDGGVIWGGARVLDGAGNQLSGLAKPDALFDFPLIINNDKFEVDIPQLNSSGSLLFSPLSQYIDVFDARHGTLDFRIALAEHLQGPNNFNPAAFSLHSMDTSPLGDKVFLITDAGLTVIQLDAVPLSISTITPASSGPGTQITVRGSGFTASSTVSLNGSPAATTFTDSTTLVVTVPPAATGMQRATVLNLDGTSYSLDGAFRVP
ncbi:MAG TPA: IPT/TIG domain-containing protein, partial [Terriglobales bacterium]|nr:IPT/TIG domain-containing protein [Terriglobales bacterium]